MVFQDGVVIGADSRTSSGSFVANRVSDKLTQVTENIFCCRSAVAADTQALTDAVKYHLELHSIMYDRPVSVYHGATCFKNMSYDYRDQLTAGFIVAGFDNERGGQIYNVPLGGSIHSVPVTCSGSGSTYIMGFLDELYSPGMTEEQCVKLVTKGLIHSLMHCTD